MCLLGVSFGDVDSARKEKMLLISLYRERRCLWDPADNAYKNTYKKNIAWSEIADMTKKTAVQLKAEINELRCQFTREQKKAKTRVTGQSADAVYVPKWYLYNEMLFLADRAATRRTISNVADANDTSEYSEQQADDVEAHEFGSESLPVRFASTINAPIGTRNADDTDVDALSGTGSCTSISITSSTPLSHGYRDVQRH
jgi:hypothetical protein